MDLVVGAHLAFSDSDLYVLALFLFFLLGLSVLVEFHVGLYELHHFEETAMAIDEHIQSPLLQPDGYGDFLLEVVHHVADDGGVGHRVELVVVQGHQGANTQSLHDVHDLEGVGLDELQFFDQVGHALDDLPAGLALERVFGQVDLVLGQDLDLGLQGLFVPALHLQDTLVDQVDDFLAEVDDLLGDVLRLDGFLVYCLLGGAHVGGHGGRVGGRPGHDPGVLVTVLASQLDLSVGRTHRT